MATIFRTLRQHLPGRNTRPRTRWDQIHRPSESNASRFFVPNKNRSGHRGICGIKTPSFQSLVVNGHGLHEFNTHDISFMFNLLKKSWCICLLLSGFVHSWVFAVCLALLTICFISSMIVEMPLFSGWCDENSPCKRQGPWNSEMEYSPNNFETVSRQNLGPLLKVSSIVSYILRKMSPISKKGCSSFSGTIRKRFAKVSRSSTFSFQLRTPRLHQLVENLGRPSYRKVAKVGRCFLTHMKII